MTFSIMPNTLTEDVPVAAYIQRELCERAQKIDEGHLPTVKLVKDALSIPGTKCYGCTEHSENCRTLVNQVWNQLTKENVPNIATKWAGLDETAS